MHQTFPRRLLLGFDRSYWAYCLGTIFAFFGAFAGLLPAAAYDAHAGKTTTTGAWYSAVGVIQFIAIPLGAMVPPLLLVVLPNYFYRQANRNLAWSGMHLVLHTSWQQS